jgi:hypothetical protein
LGTQTEDRSKIQRQGYAGESFSPPYSGGANVSSWGVYPVRVKQDTARTTSQVPGVTSWEVDLKITPEAGPLRGKSRKRKNNRPNSLGSVFFVIFAETQTNTTCCSMRSTDELCDYTVVAVSCSIQLAKLPIASSGWVSIHHPFTNGLGARYTAAVILRLLPVQNCVL